MADSLLDFGNIAQLAQNQLRNTIAMQNMQTNQAQAENERMRLQQEDHRMQQQAVFRGFDEIEKLLKAPQFGTPERQLGLRVTQANLLKNGLGLKDMQLPSEEELRGGMEAFAENLRLFRHGADPETRKAAFEKMALSMPDYGSKLLEEMKKEGELDVQGESLRLKLEEQKANLKAMNLKYSRAAIQQGMNAEHLGGLSQATQLLDNPDFQPHVKKLQGMSQTAQKIYLRQNPQFAKAFERALKPHVDLFGGVSPEMEEAFGDDVKPRLLSALDEAIENKRRSRNEVFEKDGEIPLEMDEELSGLGLVKKAREVQYEWMKDPFNKDKLNLLKKAQQDIKIAADVAGKTMTGVEDQRAALQLTQFTAEQQEKMASGFYQDEFISNLNKGHSDNKAAELASKKTREKFGEEVIFSREAQNLDAKKRPLVENKIIQTQEKAESKKVGERFGDQYSDLQASDIASRAKMAKYDRMDQLLSGMQTSKLTPAITQIQGVAESLGLSVDKSLPAKQAFQALSGEIALTLRNPSGGAGMPGALSDRDLSFLQSMTPDLGKTTEGNKLIIDTARKLAKRDQEVAKMAREYRKKHGQFDEGFFDELAVYSEKNQLFGQASGKATPQKQSGSVLKSLPQGSRQIGTSGGKPVYEDASGKRWIGD